MAQRSFRTLPLRDNLRNCGIRLGQKTIYINADGFTGPMDLHTAESIDHMGGFAEVFDFDSPAPVDLQSQDQVERALDNAKRDEAAAAPEAADDVDAPLGSTAKRRKKGEA